MLLLKNPQFLSNHYKILPKKGTYEYLILTKFRNDCGFFNKSIFFHVYFFLQQTLGITDYYLNRN